jgi:type VI secretion system protein ImpB
MENFRKKCNIFFDTDTTKSERIQLPFIVGVIADFSGLSIKKHQNLKNSNFKEIYLDNFNEVMNFFNPVLSFKVNNLINEDSSHININLNIKSIDDFDPENIVRQIPELMQLLDISGCVQN